ncbi:predicted protein [Histoplasma capsulatum G186AR]|uniref:Histone H3 n=1 Tax=Ajellomyces capsulatus (strain G186AR / H82 / ATCC MYA-2454 / RMSCC 2432) TaxID=447093 RepID=C0NML7_AJECG|nr:uncharacterized protein HCBG_03994 [Histoplasma capsulatum G186AR]EEH07115.1 predicted protein [Histoplasma capsulatum G186AR]
MKKVDKQNVDIRVEAIHEIQYYQKSEDLIFSKTVFIYLVQKIERENYHFQYSVIKTLQVTAETILITLFEYGLKIMIHCRQMILTVRDTRLIVEIAQELRNI